MSNCSLVGLTARLPNRVGVNAKRDPTIKKTRPPCRSDRFFSGPGISIDADGSKTVPCGRHELGHTAGIRSHAVLGIADAGVQPCTTCGQSNASRNYWVERKTREQNLEIGVDFGGRMHKVRSDSPMRRCRVCSVFLDDVLADLSTSHSFDSATRLARALGGGATYIPRS